MMQQLRNTGQGSLLQHCRAKTQVHSLPFMIRRFPSMLRCFVRRRKRRRPILKDFSRLTATFAGMKKERGRRCKLWCASAIFRERGSSILRNIETIALVMTFILRWIPAGINGIRGRNKGWYGCGRFEPKIAAGS